MLTVLITAIYWYISLHSVIPAYVGSTGGQRIVGTWKINCHQRAWQVEVRQWWVEESAWDTWV